MILVALRTDNGRILNKCDAWQLDGEKVMRAWIREHGWVLTDVEITPMGNMVLWVE
jgi:hypothetical protein